MSGFIGRRGAGCNAPPCSDSSCFLPVAIKSEKKSRDDTKRERNKNVVNPPRLPCGEKCGDNKDRSNKYHKAPKHIPDSIWIRKHGQDNNEHPRRESSQCFERPFRHIKYQRDTVVLLLQRISQGFVNCDQVFVSCLRYLLVLFCQSVEQFGRFCELTQRKVASIQLIKYKSRNCRNKEKSNQGETSPSELSDQTLQKIENGLQHDVLIISPNGKLMHPPTLDSDFKKDAPAGCMERLVRFLLLRARPAREWMLAGGYLKI